MFNSISEKLVDKLGKKLAKDTPFRSDFILADFRVLDSNKKSAEMLVQYDESAGVPTKEALAQTINHLYKANDGRPRVMLDFNSIKYYPKYQAVSCVVSVPKIRRPFADVKKFGMKEIVAGTMFLGENMTDTWSVSKSAEGGAIFIERLEDDDIDTILKERSRAKGFRAHAGVSSLTLNRVAASVAECNYSLGDYVKCAYNGKLITAQILGLTPSGAQVRFKDGKQATITVEALHGMVKAAEESTQINLEALKEYYRKAYGYSEEELNKLVTYVK